MDAPTPQPGAITDRNLALELVRVTEAAALQAARLVGMGDKEAADQAAVDGMHMVLHTIHMDGVVVIGEGEKDEAPMLANGEVVGDGTPFHFSTITSEEDPSPSTKRPRDASCSARTCCASSASPRVYGLTIAVPSRIRSVHAAASARGVKPSTPVASALHRSS